MGRTLIIFGTRKGTTETTAQVIGETLVLKFGQYVELVNIRNIKKLRNRFDEFDSLIVGTSIVSGRWVSKVLRFLKKNEFRDKKVALFVTAGGTLNKVKKYGLSIEEVREEAIRNYIDRYLNVLLFVPVSKMAFGGMVIRSGKEKYNSWNREDIENWAVQLGKMFKKGVGPKQNK
jgi:menaquinone-dependent protoporphyrinogen IX oxidase